MLSVLLVPVGHADNGLLARLSESLSELLEVPVSVSAEATPVDYIYEQPVDRLLASLLPKYVEVEIFRAMLESAAP